MIRLTKRSMTRLRSSGKSAPSTIPILLWPPISATLESQLTRWSCFLKAFNASEGENREMEYVDDDNGEDSEDDHENEDAEDVAEMSEGEDAERIE